MNFQNRETEPMPEGAAQSHEQPMVEKSIADALLERIASIEANLAAAQRYVSDANEEVNRLRARVAELEKENASLRECLSFVPGYDLHNKETPASFLEVSDWLAKRSEILKK